MIRGTLAADDLARLIAAGAIGPSDAIDPGQVQPASIDLRLTGEAYRLPGSSLPLRGERVRDLIEGLAVERLDASQPLCLARNHVYWLRLAERFDLPPDFEAYANSKSSTGRVDLATRVVCDGSPRYDRVPRGYRGALWVELIPRSFDVVVSAGDSLNQAIVFSHRHILPQADLLDRHRTEPLVWHGNQPVAAEDCVIDGRLILRAHLEGEQVGFVAKPSHRPLVFRATAGHRVADYFTPLLRPESGWLFLEKDRFYILATRERVVVPADLACEMVPYDAAAGEFRAHYAGFFDPGWGCKASRPGARAVLEVRPHSDDLLLRHGQPICAMAYETLSQPCTRLYGTAGNNYADQDGPQLSKHFA